MAAPRRYTADHAVSFLRAHYDDPRIELEPLSGGTWSTAFGFRHDGTNRLAKRCAGRGGGGPQGPLRSLGQAPMAPVLTST